MRAGVQQEIKQEVRGILNMPEGQCAAQAVENVAEETRGINSGGLERAVVFAEEVPTGLEPVSRASACVGIGGVDF